MRNKQNKKDNISKKPNNLELNKQDISYRGEVIVTLTKDGRKINRFTIKNNGTSLLFKGMAIALIGNLDYSLIPNFIGVGNGDNTQIEDFKLNSEIIRIPLNYRTIQEGEGGYFAIVGTIIPYTSLNENLTITEIGLFGESLGNNLLAKISLKSTYTIDNNQVTINNITYYVNNNKLYSDSTHSNEVTSFKYTISDNTIIIDNSIKPKEGINIILEWRLFIKNE